MKHSRLFWIIPLACLLAITTVVVLHAESNVKEPSVAGSFYPADRLSLSTMVKGFLSRATTTPVDGELIALIAPHAGYQFSGQVAAFAYKHLQDRSVDTVILVGPSHYADIAGAAVYASGGMRTPLGVVKINSSLAKSLIDDAHHVSALSAAFEKEHSLEVQLPFLQNVLAKFTIVPILIGRPSQDSFASLVASLTDALRRNDRAIIIASTDLSHYHDDATAHAMDDRVIDSVLRMSLEDLEQSFRTGRGEMCGGWPVVLTMAVARELGATNGVVYAAANSGDAIGDRRRVVGYAAMGLYRTALLKSQEAELLALAKRTVTMYVREGRTPSFEPRDRRLAANGATFVTINRNGRLRGCIGNIIPTGPLWQSVISNAVSACSRDPRFPPMTPDELNNLEIEVTVLSPFELVQDIGSIKIGTHGLYLVKDDSSGILLPQVAQEYHWDVPTFLQEISLKAGLPKDAWKTGRLYSFTAQVIR